MDPDASQREIFDYVVAGAGAGGGPLAARLAEGGMRVLLLEAGGREAGGDYAVPAFNALASEDPSMSWRFFVRHYEDDEQQRRDPKYVPAEDGVFYPRAAAVGGCTAHNAMITVAPQDSDWDLIADLTGDQSWRADRMRRYFELLEYCDYLPKPWTLPRDRRLRATLARLPLIGERLRNDARHGFDGWLHTALADPWLAVQDREVLKVLLGAATGALSDFLHRPLEPAEGLDQAVDPNDWAYRNCLDGLWQIPLATRNGRRNSARERILDVAARLPGNLVVRTNALVTRIVLDETNRATGVEYADAPHAYRAGPRPRELPLPPVVTVLARREVILACGAFNTPQLLKLSGIGPRAELESFGIPVRAELPGVGENLQDRYEVGVVSEMAHDFSLLRGDRFRPPGPGEAPDPAYRDWLAGHGIYTTNGAVAAVVARSDPKLEDPDLFLFGLPGRFTGYYPGYSAELEQYHNYFTWAVLKARTRNRAGRVLLGSADPRDTPRIVFRYFEEGSDVAGVDLDAVVHGIELARGIMRRASGVVRREVAPGPEVATRDELRAWVRDQAWGHHASCTCPIGPAGNRNAVVDSRFRVHGVPGLRIVDASVFPRIPGFFIVTPTYILAEKAGSTILADAGVVPPRRPAADDTQRAPL